MGKFSINIDDMLNLFIEKKITYLLGAGASAPFFGSLGAFEDLLSHESMRSQDKKFLKILFYIVSIKKNEELCIDKSDNKRNAILQEYKHFLYNTVEYLKYNNSRLSPRRTTIMTTNYDLFLEQAAEELNYENSRIFINDGSSGFFTKYFNTDNFNKAMLHRGIDDNYSREIPTLNIIKCHGSANWEKINNKEIKLLNHDYIFLKINDKLKNIRNELVLPDEWNTKENTDDANLIELFFKSVYKLKRYEELKREGQENEFEDTIIKICCFVDNNREIINKIYKEIEKLQIVWPTKEKLERTLINQNYYEMLRLLSYEIETDERLLIVFGFSFYDEHITNIVKRSLSNPGLIVIVFCYSENSKKEIIKQFGFKKNTNINNLKFISPNDFKINEVNSDNIDNKKYLVIENNDIKVFYDKRLVRVKNESHEEAVISFNTFNKLLSKAIPNKYIYHIEKELNNDY